MREQCSAGQYVARSAVFRKQFRWHNDEVLVLFRVSVIVRRALLDELRFEKPRPRQTGPRLYEIPMFSPKEKRPRRSGAAFSLLRAERLVEAPR